MKICITGGGTGGHLMIAESLVQAGTSRGHEMIFIGSMSGQDRAYFQESSLFLEVYFLDTKGVVNQKGLGKLASLFKILKAFFISRKILKKHKIQACYSVGGFSAAPASFASLSLFVPLFIHEQNAVSGRLNSLLKPFAKRFISAYDTQSPIQGYPIQEDFVKSAHIRKKVKTVIFLGGSQGARAINDLALDVAQSLKDSGIEIVHQCGDRDLLRVQKAYSDMKIDVELYGFTKNIHSLIARADLAVSRAGASTLWELVANGVPTLFIPYPYAASDHQYFNARFIVQNDLGWCHREGEDLSEILLALLDSDLEDKSKRLLEYSLHDVAIKMIVDLEENIL